MAWRFFHMSLYVPDILKNWHVETMRGLFKDPTGRLLSGQECKDLLIEELAKGHRYLPSGPDCTNFDYHNGGCQGH